MIKTFSLNSLIYIFSINKGLVSITTSRLLNASQIKMSTSAEFVEGVVCKVSDIQENELKTFLLGNGEVLLVKQNNVISALGSKCTHYGAPLAKGALGNGRIRCPWHGACFKISTGDIEEFPEKGKKSGNFDWHDSIDPNVLRTKSTKHFGNNIWK
ncbi:unnamed protein product [Diabrotica balteata]|uniref:Rieske domain-containing protein n=1 Tax=Diabrotica balteata TaxID=107213 RepID=A0A9N9TC59_DIABA|nr:unnamed protein product [Diabrotica balteata]